MGENGNLDLAARIGEAAVAKGLTAATAESCTAGLVSAALVDWPGASGYFLEGVATYSNEAKIARLGVLRSTLEEHGAVSSQTAMEMAAGAARTSGADLAVATTGVAGPGGGSPEKPVGLVWIGVYAQGAARAESHAFAGDRAQVRAQATRAALEALLAAAEAY